MRTCCAHCTAGLLTCRWQQVMLPDLCRCVQGVHYCIMCCYNCAGLCAGQAILGHLLVKILVLFFLVFWGIIIACQFSQSGQL